MYALETDRRHRLLRARRERPSSCCAAQWNNEFSPSDVDCHAYPPAGGRVHAIEVRYHALAKERTHGFALRNVCRRPCRSMGQTLRSQTAFALFVRYASRSDQTIAAQRNDATCQKRIIGSAYSITSSARASSVAGTVMPSALAVWLLMTISNRVACRSGSSPGWVPPRIFATCSAAFV